MHNKNYYTNLAAQINNLKTINWFINRKRTIAQIIPPTKEKSKFILIKKHIKLIGGLH